MQTCELFTREGGSLGSFKIRGQKPRVVQPVRGTIGGNAVGAVHRPGTFQIEGEGSFKPGQILQMTFGDSTFAVSVTSAEALEKNQVALEVEAI